MSGTARLQDDLRLLERLPQDQQQGEMQAMARLWGNMAALRVPGELQPESTRLLIEVQATRFGLNVAPVLDAFNAGLVEIQSIQNDEMGQQGALQTFSMAELCEQTDLETIWVVGGLMSYGMLTCMHAPPKDGKTLTALDIAACVARGGDQWAGLPASGEPAPVLFMTEMHPSALVEKATDVLNMPDDGIYYAPAHMKNLELRRVEDVVGAAEEKATCLGARVIVFDTLAHWARLGPGDENDNSTMEHVCTQIRKLAINGDRAVLMLAHSKKNGDAGPIAGLRGAGAIAGVADAVVRLCRTKGTEENQRRLQGQGRLEAHNLNHLVELDHEARMFRKSRDPKHMKDDEDDQRLTSAVDELQAASPDAKGFGIGKVRDQAGMNMAKVRSRLGWLTRVTGPLEHSRHGYRRVSA